VETLTEEINDRLADVLRQGGKSLQAAGFWLKAA
jgi:hypothetical protein